MEDKATQDVPRATSFWFVQRYQLVEGRYRYKYVGIHIMDDFGFLVPMPAVALAVSLRS